MPRKAPGSPARAEAALDAVLARAPAPALPPGLAARIVANATALPQFPAEPVAEPEVVRAQQAQETADLIAFPAQPAEIAPERLAIQAESRPRRRVFAVGGFAALAAGIAAAVVLGQPGQGTLAPASAPAAVVAQQQAVSPEVASPAAPTVPVVERLAAVPAAPAAARAQSGEIPLIAPDAPPKAPVAVPAETQLATSGERPAGATAGPQVDPSTPVRVVPQGGLMGPPAPQQGWGFSGGIPGAGTLPGGQSLPSQTTGSMPPPPPPGGGPAGGPAGGMGGHR